jgi:hypothetical protein
MFERVNEGEMKPGDIAWLHAEHVARLEAIKPSNEAFDREAGTGNVIVKHDMLVVAANSLLVVSSTFCNFYQLK